VTCVYLVDLVVMLDALGPICLDLCGRRRGCSSLVSSQHLEHQRTYGDGAQRMTETTNMGMGMGMMDPMAAGGHERCAGGPSLTRVGLKSMQD
jgi:hypothetical protein